MSELILKKFFESTPPGKKYNVPEFDVIMEKRRGFDCLNVPDLRLYCSTSGCDGIRTYMPLNKDSLRVEAYLRKGLFVAYQCRNCRESTKVYAIDVEFSEDHRGLTLEKLGETPPFGPPVPSRVYKLIGGERKLFLSGLRSESQGMGIGAFAYYRRVVESQKDRIFDELIRVISKISPGNDVISKLEEAKAENQFIKAAKPIKDALPESLHINGYDPMTLLYSALSKGVHEHNDEKCLELASDVRTVLFEFSEKLYTAS